MVKEKSKEKAYTVGGLVFVGAFMIGLGLGIFTGLRLSVHWLDLV